MGEGTLAGMRMIRVGKPRKLEVRGSSTLLPVQGGRKRPSGSRISAGFLIKNP
jgi:hypothetical protein